MEPDNSDAKAIPYWLVNVPRDKWPAECPEYLRNLSDKDVEQLGVLDEDYQSLTWDEVRQIVGTVVLFLTVTVLLLFLLSIPGQALYYTVSSRFR